MFASHAACGVGHLFGGVESAGVVRACELVDVAVQVCHRDVVVGAVQAHFIIAQKLSMLSR